LQIEVPSMEWGAKQNQKGVTKEQVSAPQADLSGKWIIVTGGNSGIGREAALQFAAWGASVLIACRDNSPPHEPRPDKVVEELQETAKKNGHVTSEFDWWHVDYADLKSVEAFASRWLETGRPLDVLANNVRITKIGTLSSGADKYRLELDRLPELRRSRRPRTDLRCTTKSTSCPIPF
jgi:NAD(P)-dependent dehydrogenase (short-subunit alcohol dehydrogenase family)